MTDDPVFGSLIGTLLIEAACNADAQAWDGVNGDYARQQRAEILIWADPPAEAKKAIRAAQNASYEERL